MFGLKAPREGLDDDHAATAAWARHRQSAWLIGFRNGIEMVLSVLRRGEQLARTSDIGGAVFALANSP